MTCQKCGFEFEGNYCSNCGTKEETLIDSAYPQAPIGEYKGLSCSVSVSDQSLTIWKKYGKSETVVPFRDIAKAFFKKGLMGGFLCIRTADTVSKPMATGFNSPNDPLSVDFPSQDSSTFLCLYEFLEKVSSINNYSIPEVIKSPVKSVPIRHPVQSTKGNHFVPSGKTLLAQTDESKPLSKRERIKENKKNGVACCPKCGSTSLSASKQGIGIGKAAVGVWALGPIGAAAGAIGAKKTHVTCLNCGNKWKL